MIDVELNDRSYEYDIYSLIRAFFPEEEIRVRDPEQEIPPDGEEISFHFEIACEAKEIFVRWAQSGRGIPCYGTTHADYMYGEIPCLRCLTREDIEGAYEKNTGLLIAEYFKDKEYMAVPACLCKNHGPFAWGKDAMEAVHNAVVLEEVAKMAACCELINPKVQPAPQELQDKHYLRKHGASAYYGQQ